MTPRRPAFTLIELLVALTITAILGVITTTVLSIHQKLLLHVTNTVTTQDLLREASDILTADLRSTASTPDAFSFASDTAIEFLSVIGVSTLCQSPASTLLSLPPDTLTSGAMLSSWTTRPDSADIAVIYHDSSAVAPTRGWLHFPITTLNPSPTTTTCPPATGFTTPADAPYTSYTLTLQTPPPLSIQKGAPIRFLRRARYSLYRASDSHWYLGYRRCHAVTRICEGIQPVSGPYTKGKTPPITFRYYTATGPIPPPNAAVRDLTRIDISIHATPKRTVKLRGISPDTSSLTTTIALRNTP